MGYIVGDTFQLKLNKFSEEIENLQSKCLGRADVRQSDLTKLGSILQDFSAMRTTLMENRRFVVEENGQSSVARAIMAILSFQRLMPSQMDTKTITEMFARLFSVLSTEIRKLEEVDNKLERHKRFKRIVEKSQKGEKAS